MYEVIVLFHVGFFQNLLKTRDCNFTDVKWIHII